jgi:hypothetical protein
MPYDQKGLSIALQMRSLLLIESLDLRPSEGDFKLLTFCKNVWVWQRMCVKL